MTILMSLFLGIVLSLSTVIADCLDNQVIGDDPEQTAVAPSGGTGLEGVVTLGPTAPTCLPGMSCSQPQAASVVVEDSSGTQVAQFTSGADGHFQVDLAPGTYTLVPQRLHPGTNYPHAIRSTATVPASGYAQVEVSYDTLIR
jgi:hypothetical protein